ncbi:MAG: sulfotransferase domain-containing protein [Scytolyngbya sp. HA4215-MV1]|jgi:hypothetical protein|nr:sulfotransferase domain-containing protein [Scytolyngbya sp. HA4215-MV1]
MSTQPIPTHPSTSGQLANLVIIGAMKCGTSSLHRYLNLHPEIQMSKSKELDFFIKEKNWQRGLDWYQSHFTESAKVRGEASPNYTKHSIFRGVPERMHQIIPEAKLIYLVRDPIQRIVSHYLHNFIDRHELRSLPDALQNLESNHYLHCSLYYQQLQQFLTYYSPEQILVVSLETLAYDRLKTLRKIFQFLEVDSEFQHPDFFQIFHQSNQKKRLTHWGVRVVQLPSGGRLRKILPGLLEESIATPIVSEDLRQSLVQMLSNDIEQLKAFTQLPFAEWSV